MKALITTTPFEIEKSIYAKKLKKLGVDIIFNQKNSNVIIFDIKNYF